MTALKRIFLWGMILALVIFIAGTAYVKLYGKNLLETALSRAMQRTVTLGQASYAFPLGLKARDVTIVQPFEGGKMLTARDIVVQLSTDAFFQRKLIFDSVAVLMPVVVIEKDVKAGEELPERRYGVNIPAVAVEELPAQVAPKPAPPETGLENPKTAITAIVIKTALLRDGQVQYINHFGEKDFSFTLADVFLKAQNLIFPVKADRTAFRLSARLVKEGNPLTGSQVEGEGWIDFVGRNMDARAEIIEQDGTVGLTVRAVAQNNDMDVSGEVKFQNLFAGVSKKSDEETPALDTLVMDALSSAGVEIGAKYSFKTKMDDFRLEKVSFSGNVVTK